MIAISAACSKLRRTKRLQKTAMRVKRTLEVRGADFVELTEADIAEEERGDISRGRRRERKRKRKGERVDFTAPAARCRDEACVLLL